MRRAEPTQQSPILSPDAAYDALAAYYRSYSETRMPYLRTIEEIISAHARHADSLLDVGAGDGVRALRIAGSAKISRVVLLEPSAGMLAHCPAMPGVEIWPFPASDIPTTTPRFQIITCLWNVLGHIPQSGERVGLLKNLRQLLLPGGAIFLDVHHRYNGASYGWTRTFCRWVHDWFVSSDQHGDVIVAWPAGGRIIRTHGHVFTAAEIERLVRSAGLRIVNRWVVDYQSGRKRRFPVSGNLLYQLAA